MIRFKYYILTIVSIFFSLTFGLLIGISLGEDHITFQQAQVIDNLKEELSSYEKDFGSLKKETKDMKNTLNTWETKGEVFKKEITKNINDNKLSSIPELIVVGEERFVDNKRDILSDWNIDVTSQFVNSSRFEYYINENLDKLKSKKLIVSNNTFNDELKEIFEEKEIEYKIVSIQDTNGLLDEFKLINEILGIEELLN
ncbi:copper transporter [Natranaerofaba carboxydovora]|uniref:copper transporter n=1 Tax=Natranaerofaba carboxydovora TaxID=2742683 RepID=UPI001F139967|nr:copper transporter [Natranaerofaba carboxydovora]UMZ73938.1 Copper transport outer membrane protein, MctB [Natranaerofaba carboxydovora]